MFKASSVLKAGVATVAASGLVLGAAVSAQADPSTFRTYAAVGSDTTQDVWNGLGASLDVGSYNAFPINPAVTTIQTKAAGATFLRPAGSGNGVKALSAAWDPANHNWSGTTLSSIDVDFARSSSAPTAAQQLGSDLTYLRFARDAVSVAYNPYSETAINLSTSQLTELYSGVNNAGNDTNGTVVAVTGGVPTIGGNQVFPKLPQNGSGTRSFFLTAIGSPTLASYVEPTASTLPENDGSVLTGDGWLIPFSAAQWIAQKKATGGVADTTTGLLLASINGQAPTNGASTAAALAPGALYGTSVGNDYTEVPTAGAGNFNRDTFNVVPSSFLGEDATTPQTALVSRLTAGLNGSSSNATVIRSYGFGTLSYLGINSLKSVFQH